MENMIYLERGKTYSNGWDLNNNRVSFEVGNKRRWNFEKIGSVEVNPLCIVLFSFGYVWFPENLRENARERKYKGKIEGKKK